MTAMRLEETYLRPWMLHHGDALDVLATLPAASVQCCVTSPPYFGLRDYGAAGQIGLEPTPAAYVASLVAVFHEVHRVLRDDGTLWLNVGDSYASGPGGNVGVTSQAGPKHKAARGRGPVPADMKPKDLIGIPWRVAFALQEDGWWLRSDIIWAKPNPMPESVTDRPTRSHEYLFLLSKRATYYYDATAIQERSILPAGTAGTWNGNRDFGLPGGGTREARPNLGGSIDGSRNRRTVWTINTRPYAEAHFAVMPEKLVEPCILAGSRPGDTVLDPFVGSGTVPLVAARFNRRAIGIDLNADYLALAERRLMGQPMALPLEGLL